MQVLVGPVFIFIIIIKLVMHDVTLQTAMLYPSVMFGTCFLLNFFILGKHSSGAVSELFVSCCSDILTRYKTYTESLSDIITRGWALNKVHNSCWQ